MESQSICLYVLHFRSLLQFRSTLTSSTGLKTRNFGTIISELTSCLRIHTACKSHLAGVSLEFTGEFNDDGFSVTECTGGSMEMSEEQLGLRYQVWSLLYLLCDAYPPFQVFL
jgi:3-deoxy-D-arabino-heptulosonate 7-phosphate (DAHP) synthase class II